MSNLSINLQKKKKKKKKKNTKVKKKFVNVYELNKRKKICAFVLKIIADNN